MERFSAFNFYRSSLAYAERGSSMVESLFAAAVLLVSVSAFAQLLHSQSRTQSALANKTAALELLSNLTLESTDWDSLLWSSNKSQLNRKALLPCIDRDADTTCNAEMTYFHVFEAGESQSLLSGDTRERIATFDKELKPCRGNQCSILSLSLLFPRCERSGKRCHDAQTIEVRHYVFNLMDPNVSVQKIRQSVDHLTSPKEKMKALKDISYSSSMVHIDRGFMNSWKRLANAYCPAGQALRGLNYDYTANCIDVPSN